MQSLCIEVNSQRIVSKCIVGSKDETETAEPKYPNMASIDYVVCSAKGGLHQGEWQ